MYKTVLVEREAKITTVTLNRPDSHNAFNPLMVAELTRVFKEMHDAPDARVMVLTGAGSTFCAGADLTAMQEAALRPFDENMADSRAIWDLMAALDACPLPVVGRINGSAFGGAVGLISCCDIAVAVKRAKFAFSEVRLGLAPAVIAPFVVARIGLRNARELFLTGERFNASRAKVAGLVHHLVEDEDLDAAVSERTRQLLAGAPGAQRAVKSLLRELDDIDRLALRQYTTELISRLRAGAEGQEGLSSFLDKRRPDWQA